MQINTNYQVVKANVAQVEQKARNTRTVVQQNNARNLEIQDTLELNTDQIVQRTQMYRANLERITKDLVYLERKSTSFFGRKGPIP